MSADGSKANAQALRAIRTSVRNAQKSLSVMRNTLLQHRDSMLDSDIARTEREIRTCFRIVSLGTAALGGLPSDTDQRVLHLNAALDGIAHLSEDL